MRTMVAGASVFEDPKFSLPQQTFWYVRKAGWVRGPYSLADMRRFRKLNWLSSSEAVSQDMEVWSPANQVAELWSDEEAPTQPKAVPPPPLTTASPLWHFTSLGARHEEPVTLATLQILASLGRVREDDLVWREGWPAWRKAAEVPGIIAGPSDWCSACGEPTVLGAHRCRSCGAKLPGFSVPHSELCLACGVLGVILFPVFPLWMIALFLGHLDLAEIARGRMDPGGANAARLGQRLGIVGGALFSFVTAWVLIYLWTNTPQ